MQLHYRDDIRGMALPHNTPFDEFVQLVNKKFGSTRGLALKFKDEGGNISLKDESDYELAIETVSPRPGPNGTADGKLEIWCVDL
jgi:hypothetical protein